MALAATGSAVVAWKCTLGASSQQWTGYNDGPLRTGGGAGHRRRPAPCWAGRRFIAGRMIKVQCEPAAIR